MKNKNFSLERFISRIFGTGKLMIAFSGSILFIRHIQLLPSSFDNLVLLNVNVVDILFIYLFLNCLGMVPVTYIERQTKIRKGVNCPECGRELHFSGYECPSCGVIEFKRPTRGLIG